MGCCGGSGVGAGFPAPCVAPIPTISCAGFSGPPESYMYDDFSEDRGWWNLTAGTAFIDTVNGEMRTSPPLDIKMISVVSYLASQNPTGAQVVTQRANFVYQVNSGITYSCGIYMGGVWCTLGFRTGSPVNDAFRVGTGSPPSSTGLLYEESLGLPNLTIADFELKIEADTTESRYYLNGVLKYTRPGALDVFTSKPTVRVCYSELAGVTTKFGFCKDYLLMGYGLPAYC